MKGRIVSSVEAPRSIQALREGTPVGSRTLGDADARARNDSLRSVRRPGLGALGGHASAACAYVRAFVFHPRKLYSVGRTRSSWRRARRLGRRAPVRGGVPWAHFTQPLLVTVPTKKRAARQCRVYRRTAPERIIDAFSS
ncbi:hypothetical protein MTO96_010797 [Rhipicephalus appendiculatus]